MKAVLADGSKRTFRTEPGASDDPSKPVAFSAEGPGRWGPTDHPGDAQRGAVPGDIRIWFRPRRPAGPARRGWFDPCWGFVRGGRVGTDLHRHWGSRDDSSDPRRQVVLGLLLGLPRPVQRRPRCYPRRGRQEGRWQALNQNHGETRGFALCFGSNSNFGQSRSTMTMSSLLIDATNARQAARNAVRLLWQRLRVTSLRIQSHSCSIGLRSGLQPGNGTNSMPNSTASSWTIRVMWQGAFSQMITTRPVTPACQWSTRSKKWQVAIASHGPSFQIRHCP